MILWERFCLLTNPDFQANSFMLKMNDLHKSLRPVDNSNNKITQKAFLLSSKCESTERIKAKNISLESFSRRRTTKIFASRLLELLLRKSWCKLFSYLIFLSENVVCVQVVLNHVTALACHRRQSHSV